MRQRLFKSPFYYGIVFAVFFTVFSLAVFGQKAKSVRLECADSDYDCMIVRFSEDIRQKPNEAEIYYARGIAFYHLQKIDLAMADFDKAISLNPKFEDAFH